MLKSIETPETSVEIIIQAMNSSGIETSLTSLVISARELPQHLLSAVQLKFNNNLWTIVWLDEVSAMKFWRIDVLNIDSINVHPLELLTVLEQTIFQLLNLIIMEECIQSVIVSEDIDCFEIDYLPKLRKDFIVQLLQSYKTNNSECLKSEFYADNFEMQINGIFEQITAVHENPFEIKLTTDVICFEVNLCH